MLTRKQQKKLADSFKPKTPSARRPLRRMLKVPHNSINSSRREASRTSSESEEEVETSESEHAESPEDLRCSSTREQSPLSSTPSPRPLRRSKNTSAGSEIFDSSNYSQKTPKTSDKSHQSSPRSSRTKNSHSNSYFCIICFFLLGLVGLMIASLHSDAKNITIFHEKSPNREELLQKNLVNLGKNIDEIKEKFKHQYPEIWNDIEAGIAEVLMDPRRPTVFLFFSNQDDPMFCLAKMIGDASKTALGTDNNLYLSPENMGEDYGTVIQNFRDAIKQQKVVIVENLLDIHPEAIKAFHNLCDRENPAVPEAVYIITMIAHNYKNESYIEFVEEQLTRRLSGKVDDDKLQPLITRITDAAIIHVQPEPSVKSCPLRY